MHVEEKTQFARAMHYSRETEEHAIREEAMPTAETSESPAAARSWRGLAVANGAPSGPDSARLSTCDAQRYRPSIVAVLSVLAPARCLRSRASPAPRASTEVAARTVVECAAMELATALAGCWARSTSGPP